MEEGLIRNLPAFARFLDAVAYSHGGLINYANIARDCAVDAKTGLAIKKDTSPLLPGATD